MPGPSPRLLTGRNWGSGQVLKIEKLYMVRSVKGNILLNMEKLRPRKIKCLVQFYVVNKKLKYNQDRHLIYNCSLHLKYQYHPL